MIAMQELTSSQQKKTGHFMRIELEFGCEEKKKSRSHLRGRGGFSAATLVATRGGFGVAPRTSSRWKLRKIDR